MKYDAVNWIGAPLNWKYTCKCSQCKRTLQACIRQLCQCAIGAAWMHVEWMWVWKDDCKYCNGAWAWQKGCFKNFNQEDWRVHTIAFTAALWWLRLLQQHIYITVYRVAPSTGSYLSCLYTVPMMNGNESMHRYTQHINTSLCYCWNTWIHIGIFRQSQ